MVSPIKLDTFVLKDKFGLSQDQLIIEASGSAKKRAEVMSWVVDHVLPVNQQPQNEGDLLCHSFEIWGFDKSGYSESEEKNHNDSKTNTSEKYVANEANQ
jgi:hypothetical protein